MTIYRMTIPAELVVDAPDEETAREVFHALARLQLHEAGARIFLAPDDIDNGEVTG